MRSASTASCCAAAWALSQWDKGTDLESLFVYSHNTEILRDIQQRRRIVDDMVAEQLASIRRMKANAVARSAEQRNYEVAAARQQHRARMMALSSALQSMGQTPASSAYSTSPATTRRGSPSTTQGGCSSDFSCGIGYTCVKNTFQSIGYCAKAVNEYGVQTYDLPDPASVGPKMPVSTDCKGLGDCPIGFSCDLRSGACIK